MPARRPGEKEKARVQDIIMAKAKEKEKEEEKAKVDVMVPTLMAEAMGIFRYPTGLLLTRPAATNVGV